MKLTDLEPQFMRYVTNESGNYLHHVETVAEAQGIQFLCPVCFVKNGGNVGTHGIEVSFADRGVQDHQGSHNREGKPSRWNVSGTGYTDLTTTPSILIDPAKPACDGWHGYITNGEVA
jgi:hypothetical protein